MPSQTDRATRTDDVISDTCTSKERHPELSTLQASDNTIPYFIRANSTFLTVRINWFTPRWWKNHYAFWHITIPLTLTSAFLPGLSRIACQYLIHQLHHSNSLNNLNFEQKIFWNIPWGSMYGIFTYIWLIFMGNVGKYAIHGSSGYKSNVQKESLLSRNHDYSLMYRFEMLLFSNLWLVWLECVFWKEFKGKWCSQCRQSTGDLKTPLWLYDSLFGANFVHSKTCLQGCLFPSFPPSWRSRR